MAATFEYDVIIVGAGPAGMCAGMYAGRAMLKAVVLERGNPGGELLNTELIEDYPGFESVLGHELAEKFASHAKKFGAEFREYVTVERVKRLDDGSFEVVAADSGDRYLAPAVIVTAGGTPIKLGIPGELEYAGKGVSYCAICDGAFFRNQTIAVVGGGDAATEEADFLTRFADKVYLIHRRDELRSSKILQKRLFENKKVEVIWDTVVESAVGDATGLTTLKLHNVKSGGRSDLNVSGLFIFVGFRPNTGIVADHVEHDEMGYIKTDQNMQTSIRGLFAAGDLRSQLTRQVTTAVGDATTAAIATEKYLKALKDGTPEAEIVGSGGYTS